MHDASSPAGRPLSPYGLTAHPTGTLVERALEYLETGPADSRTLTKDVLGLPAAPVAVAERLAVALLGADPRVKRLTDGRWELALEARPSPALENCTFAVVDVETTGMRARGGDRVTEIAVALLGAGGVELAYEALINPGRPIPAEITALTRITNDMVRDRPTFDALADDVLSALAGRVFVAHNVRFDWGFVSAEIERSRSVRLSGPRLCTVELSKRLVPGLKSRNLDSVTTYFGIDVGDRHRAAGDAIATARVLQRLLDAARGLGAQTLADLDRVDARVKARKSAGPTSMDAI